MRISMQGRQDLGDLWGVMESFYLAGQVPIYIHVQALMGIKQYQDNSNPSLLQHRAQREKPRPESNSS